MSKRQVIIGVDGGGSKSIGVAVTSDGNVVGLCRGKGINYRSLGMEKARENLEELVHALLAVCDGEPLVLSIGMPALDTTADADTVRCFAGNTFDPDRLIMESDAFVALQGMTLGQPGMIVICGTGSMAVLADETGKQSWIGGWGYLLGDPGSGYALALDGLRAAINAWEGIREETNLTQRASSFFQLDDPRELIDIIYAPEFSPDAVARFAPEVFIAAQEGDQTAYSVIHRNLCHLAAEAALLLKTAPEVENVGLYGGIFQYHDLARKLFSETLQKKLGNRSFHIVSPILPPECGAVIHWMKKNHLLNDQILQQIKESYHMIAQKGALSV